MKIISYDLMNVVMPTSRVEEITHANGGKTYIYRKPSAGVTKTPTPNKRFPPVNRDEPMTKAAYRQTLNRYFEKLARLDLSNFNCHFLTLTINDRKYNDYEKISARFKVFIKKVRLSPKSNNAYVGTVRFIEVQNNGFYHIHCILVFKRRTIKLNVKDYHDMWGWGYVYLEPVGYTLGLFDYLTNPKTGANYSKVSKFTRYPKGARIIYISPNLPTGESVVTTMTTRDYDKLIADGTAIGHIKTHFYRDPKTQRKCQCTDKVVITKNLEKKKELWINGTLE